MREHLHKGFHPYKNGTTEITLNGEKINGEWIEGYLVEQDEPKYHAYIISDFNAEVDENYTDILSCDIHEVLPETVCEYTGLTDRNGNKVFENDIVKVKFWSDWGECYEVSNGTIKWENGKYIIHISHYSMRLDLCDHPEMELVENIFESQ